MLTLLWAILIAATPPGPVGLHRPEPADQPAPEVILLDQVAGCYGAVKFDHTLHVSMATMNGGCVTCHHEAQEGTRIQTCRSCHEPASAAVTTDIPGLKGAYHRQCLGCHKDWAHQNACGFCHTGSTSIADAPDHTRLHRLLQPRAEARPTYTYQTGHKGLPMVTFHHDDHTRAFGLSCVECHGGDSCNRCHGPDSAAAEQRVVNRQETCYRCHAESRCVTCHGLSEKPKFDHAQCGGWKLRPAHAALACVDCHEPGAMPEKPRSSACTACHGAETVGGFDHTRTGVTLYGSHGSFACVDCHSGRGESGTSCTGCHEDRPVRGERRVGRGLGPAASLVPPPRSPVEPTGETSMAR